jgi:hypothetical protein
MDITSFKLKKIPVSLHTSNADGGKFSVSGLYRGWIEIFRDVGKMSMLQNIYRAQDKPSVIEEHVISHPGIKHGGHIRHHWRYWQYKFTIVTFQNLQTV